MCAEPGALPVAVGQVPEEHRFETLRVRPALTEPLRPAPDFIAPAYVDGRTEYVRLSDSRGQWVVLHFYIGDFTYV